MAAAAAPALAGPAEEPVTVTAAAPLQVAQNVPFDLTVEVAAGAGALDIAQAPLRLRVRFAPECGGSFAGTEGPTAIDRALPSPPAGGAYSTKISSTATLSTLGEETICAFVEDAQERQFATDTEATLTVLTRGASCQAATRELRLLKKRSRRIDRRIHHLRRQAKRTAAKAAHQEIAKKIKRLRKKRHKLIVSSRRAKKTIASSCGAGRRG